jgi:hypothetical protein
MLRALMLSAGLTGAMILAAPARAGEVSEDLYHAKHWLEKADRDYDGHRARAVEEVRHALQHLGHDPNAHPTKIPTKPVHEKQWKSDDQLRHARKLLKEAETHLSGKGGPKRQDALADIARAVGEIDVALKKR